MPGGQDYSKEAIDVLLAKSEEHRGELVIILAGYSADMGRLIEQNQGLASRFPIRLDFADYVPAELMEIAESMASSRMQTLAPDASVLLRNNLLASPLSGNARAVRNMIERAEGARDTRLQNTCENHTLEQLTALTAADFPT